MRMHVVTLMTCFLLTRISHSFGFVTQPYQHGNIKVCRKRSHQISSAPSNDDEFLKALELAKQYDSEWLSRILDYNSLSNYTSITQSAANVRENKEETPAKVQEAAASVNTVADERLQGLGYSIQDIRRLRLNVKKIITDKNVRKPRSGIPLEWLLSVDDNTDRPIQKDSVRLEISILKDEALPLDEVKEENFSAAQMKKQYYESKKQSTSSPKLKQPSIIEEIGDRQLSSEFFDDNGSTSFWPDAEEFKDMLLDESKWRIDLIGPWSSGLVREETKWRFGVYKKWLEFLDEGLGDSFDVLPDGFDSSVTDISDTVEVDEEYERESAEEVARLRSGVNGGRLTNTIETQKAAQYERWLRNQFEETEEWPERSSLESEEIGKRKAYMPDSSNKIDWFEDGTKVTRRDGVQSSRGVRGRSSDKPVRRSTEELYDSDDL